MGTDFSPTPIKYLNCMEVAESSNLRVGKLSQKSFKFFGLNLMTSSRVMSQDFGY